MRRIVLWFLSTVTAVVLMFGYHTSTSGALTAGSETVIPGSAVPGTESSGGGTGRGSGSSGSNSAGGGTTSSSTSAGTAAVTGPVVSTQWGPVQVQVTTEGKTITDVTVLQYPNGSPMDQRINGYALPILVQETLDSQSAGIDMVSGATYTSDGYVRSLQAALDQAGL